MTDKDKKTLISDGLNHFQNSPKAYKDRFGVSIQRDKEWQKNLWLIIAPMSNFELGQEDVTRLSNSTDNL